MLFSQQAVYRRGIKTEKGLIGHNHVDFTVQSEYKRQKSTVQRTEVQGGKNGFPGRSFDRYSTDIHTLQGRQLFIVLQQLHKNDRRIMIWMLR